VSNLYNKKKITWSFAAARFILNLESMLSFPERFAQTNFFHVCSNIELKISGGASLVLFCAKYARQLDKLLLGCPVKLLSSVN